MCFIKINVLKHKSYAMSLCHMKNKCYIKTVILSLRHKIQIMLLIYCTYSRNLNLPNKYRPTAVLLKEEIHDLIHLVLKILKI